MNENSKLKLAFACCAAMALAFAGCSDDGAGSAGSKPQKCGDQVCTDTQKCVDNVCKSLCGTDVCKDDQTCEDGVCKDKPADDPCAKCDSETQICEDGVCKDKPADDPCADCASQGKVCDPATRTCIDPPEDPCSLCTDKQECVNLVCVDIDPCANKTCQDGYRCDREKDGECVAIDPCEGISCLADQTCIKAHCIDNACIEDGAEKNCGENKVCSKGECVDDGCVKDGTPVSCDEGWQCIKGLCEETACIDYFCEEGRSCKGGKCVDNECLDMTCEEGQICSKGNCTYEICLDKDPCSAGKVCNAEGACEFITAPAIALDEPEDKTTDEAGKAVSLTLHLNNAPTADVHVSCEVVTESPNKEVDAACEEIVFNADNWQHEQTIIVTGVDDYLKDGDQTYTIKVTTVSEDADFNALVAESVGLTNIDTTKAGFVFSAASLTTYEDPEAEAATFTVQLSSIPASDVSLTLSSSNEKEGIVSPKQLKFTKENWGELQTVTVKGVDDNVRDGNVNYTIFFAPSESNDEDYNGIQPVSIKVTNVDNDVAGINVNIPAEDYVIAEGESHLLSVKLNTQPRHDVTVTISVDDATEAELDIDKVVLNSENWNVGVPVSLSGVIDHEIDGDQPFKVTFTVSSEDEDYNFEPRVYSGIVKDADKADLVTILGDSPIVREGDGGFVTMSVSLASKPTKAVTVALSVTDGTELKINKPELTFKPEQWDIGQDVLVSSVDDEIVDGDIKSKVVMKMTSADAHFDGVSKEVEFTTLDNDIPGFVISSNAASFPENSGSTASMTVALQAQPTADVKVSVSSSDVTELAVTSASTLTFTQADWKTPQTVNVKVQDDNIADGTQTAVVKFVASSSDPKFNGITGQSALYTIIDNEMPSIVLTAAETTIPQASPSTTAKVRLGVQPSSNVTVTLVASDPKILSFSPATVTFTTNDWNQDKSVTVAADFNLIQSASATATIYGKASGDKNYANIESNKVNLDLVKIAEVQNFAYTGDIQSVNLPKGRYKLEVWGAESGKGSGTGTSTNGGYSSGIVTLASSTTLYVVVGGKGESGINNSVRNAVGGYNGGGYSYSHCTCNAGGAGGGATHIATKTGLLETLESSKSNVLIVAGGAGGAGWNGQGGYGGGANMSGGNGGDGNGGTVSSGYRFGLGQGGSHSACSGSNSVHAGGGGGGYYGGYAKGTLTSNAGGGGGSGFASASLSSVVGYNGNVSMPAPAGGSETGHTGNGYARITLVK
ncbi:MAG: hypothetical protein IJ165_10630 [Proteobacteria bacterium]|nr:hypothetical protein [Pseudomonadota bacterium]